VETLWAYLLRIRGLNAEMWRKPRPLHYVRPRKYRNVKILTPAFIGGLNGDWAILDNKLLWSRSKYTLCMHYQTRWWGESGGSTIIIIWNVCLVFSEASSLPDNPCASSLCVACLFHLRVLLTDTCAALVCSSLVTLVWRHYSVYTAASLFPCYMKYSPSFYFQCTNTR